MYLDREKLIRTICNESPNTIIRMLSAMKVTSRDFLHKRFELTDGCNEIYVVVTFTDDQLDIFYNDSLSERQPVTRTVIINGETWLGVLTKKLSGGDGGVFFDLEEKNRIRLKLKAKSFIRDDFENYYDGFNVEVSGR